MRLSIVYCIDLQTQRSTRPSKNISQTEYLITLDPNSLPLFLVLLHRPVAAY